MGQNLEAIRKLFLQAHGRDVVRQGKAPAGNAVLGVNQTQGADTRMVSVRHLHAGDQGPAVPDRRRSSLRGSKKHPLVCHN